MNTGGRRQQKLQYYMCSEDQYFALMLSVNWYNWTERREGAKSERGKEDERNLESWRRMLI